MRIFVAAPLRRGDTDFTQRSDGALAPLRATDRKMDAIGFADLIADREEQDRARSSAPEKSSRSHGRARRACAAATSVARLVPLNRISPWIRADCGGSRAQQREAGNGLAASALTDQTNALARRDGEIYVRVIGNAPRAVANDSERSRTSSKAAAAKRPRRAFRQRVAVGAEMSIAPVIALRQPEHDQ